MAGAFVAGAIVSKLILDTSKWSSSVSKVNSDQKKMAGMSEKTAGRFRKVGAAMTIAGAAILGVVSKSVSAFGDFDAAMTESTAIMVDLSDEMREQMKQTALEMSTKSKFAAKELGEAFYFLASAGLDAEKSVKALPVVMRFAQAGAFDLANATALLADAQSALGLKSKDAVKNQEQMVRVSDVLVKANTLANASVEQFSQALTNKSGPAMRAYGIELETGVATLAAFADQGVKGQYAGTQFAIVLRDLQKSALKNKEAFEEAGVAVYDAQGNLNNMADIIGQLEDRLGTMTTAQKKAELGTLGFTEKSQGALLTLMGTSDKIREYEAALRNAGGMTQNVSEKQLQGFNNQMTIAKNKITAAGISIGEQLAPTVVSLATVISNAVNKISEWARANPALFGTITKIVAGLGAMMAVLGPMVMMLPRLVSGLKLVAAGARTMGAAMNVSLGPIGLVTAGLLAAGAALNAWINSRKKALDAEMDAMIADTSLGDALKARKKLIEEQIITQEEWTELVNAHGRDYKAVMNAIATDPNLSKLKDALTEEKEGQEDAADATDLHKGAAEGLQTSIDGLKTKIEEIESPLDNYTMQQLQLATAYSDGEIGMGQYVSRMAKLREEREKNLALFDEEEFAIDDGIEGVDSYIAEWESVPDATLSVFQQVGIHSFDSKTEIEKHAEGMKTNVTSIWSEMADGLKTKWSTTISDFIQSGDLFKGNFSGLMDGLKTQFFDIVGQMAAKIVTGFFNVIIDGAANAASSLLGSLGSALGGAGGGVSSITGGFESVTGALTQAVNPIGMISGAVTAIASVASLFKKAGPSSTDSWHFEHIWINTKEMRDYMFIEQWKMIQYGIEQRHKIADFIWKVNEKVKDQKPILQSIDSGVHDVAKSINKLSKAQGGYTTRKSELVMLHGTPANPEHAIPDDRLRDLLSMSERGRGGAGGFNVKTDQQVNFNGLMISDRDYMRTRGIPELLSALRANEGLSELKSVLGVT